MHGNGTSGGAVGTISPGVGVVSGPTWFETDDRPLVLSVDVPLSVELMVAALYQTPGMGEEELAADEWVRGTIAVSVVVDGLPAVEKTAEMIARGQVDNARWLAFCRRRVREVVAHGWGQVAR